jgi:hypothetical protein
MPIGLLSILLDNEVSNQDNLPIIVFVMYLGQLGSYNNYDETAVSIWIWDAVDVTHYILIGEVHGSHLCLSIGHTV